MLTIHLPRSPDSTTAALTEAAVDTCSVVSVQIEASRRISLRFPETSVSVPVSGPFSIAGNLVGSATCSSKPQPGPSSSQEQCWTTWPESAPDHGMML